MRKLAVKAKKAKPVRRMAKKIEPLKKGELLFPKDRLWALVDAKGRMARRNSGDPYIFATRAAAKDEQAWRGRNGAYYRIARLSDFALEVQ